MLAALAGFLLAPPLLIRQSEVEITPPELLPLGGYTERRGKLMESGGDPLYARCIEFEQGGVKVAIVSAEMLTIPESLHREVAARIPKDVHLFLQATHTHCAPDSQMLNDRMTLSIPGIASYRRRWLAWYADKLASAVTQTLASQAVSVSEMSLMRSIVAANRARRTRGQPDPALSEVFANGKPVFAHFTAHPIVYSAQENRTRGDWPGVLAKRFGCAILNGAIGDVSPGADGPTAAARMNDFLKRIDSTDKSFTFPVWKPAMKPLSWRSQVLPLDKKQPHPQFAKENGIPDVLAKSLVNQFAPPAAEVAAFRLGDLAVVGIPGEPTSILGNEIKAAGEKLGFKAVLVCSHVNGWIGYILDPKDYDRGEYEATLSFYGRGEGPKVVKAAAEALKRLK